jgi:hypothetical protein
VVLREVDGVRHNIHRHGSSKEVEVLPATAVLMGKFL